MKNIISEKMFPFKSLLAKFAQNGIIVRNWPEGVPLLPRPRRRDDARPPPVVQAYKKGISGLPSRVQDLLVDALRNPRFPLVFERYDGKASGEHPLLHSHPSLTEQQQDLLNSKVPILYGAPPAWTNASQPRAIRMFYNGSDDRKGPPRLAPPSNRGTKDARRPNEASKPGEIPPTAVGADRPLDVAPQAAAAGAPVRRSQAKEQTQFRSLDVLISTSPQKRTASTSKRPVLDLCSSDDSSADDFQPRPAREPTKTTGTKRKARRDSVTLVSSGDDSPETRRASEKVNKGKNRAADVGLRSPSPPPLSLPHQGDTVKHPRAAVRLPSYYHA